MLFYNKNKIFENVLHNTSTFGTVKWSEHKHHCEYKCNFE